MGWRRALGVHSRRLLRLPGRAHRGAFGAAMGVCVSFLPLIGLRFIIAGASSLAVRASVVASLLGAQFGNPFVYPALFMACLEIGCLLTGSTARITVFQEWGDLLVPAALGLGLVGATTSAIVYGVVRTSVARYQERRRRRFADTRAARMAA
jgi:uncharacterized protein (DUF2062 family)